MAPPERLIPRFIKEFSLAFFARRAILNWFAHWGNRTRVVGPVIIHAPGDAPAALRLAEGLGELAPSVRSYGDFAQASKPDGRTPLVLFWSPRAAMDDLAGVYIEFAETHPGPVFVCLAYGEDLPQELAEYRLLAPDVDSAEFNAALRAQQIFLRERNERDARYDSAEKRRARARSGRAFAGGAVMGFATSVALVGALGVGAISAAGQIGGQPGGDADPGQTPPPGMPVIQPLMHDAEVPAWSAAQLERVSYAQQVAFVDQELARAESRMAAAPQVHVAPSFDPPTQFAEAAAPAPAAPADSEEMWSPAAPRLASVAPLEPLMQLTALEDRINAEELLEIPDLAPDFWRIVAGSGEVALTPVSAQGGDEDDGLWRPS
jgi:hypothetical protein